MRIYDKNLLMCLLIIQFMSLLVSCSNHAKPSNSNSIENSSQTENIEKNLWRS